MKHLLNCLLGIKRILVFIIFVIITIGVSGQVNYSGTTLSGLSPSAIGINTKALGNATFASGFGSQSTAFYTTAIGFYSFATYTKAISIGSMVKSNRDRAIVIGSGGEYSSEKFLENNIERSLMIGFNSQYPTLFVSESPYSTLYNRTGKIGIGNIIAPVAKLHLLADEGEDAAIFIQPYSWENNESSTIILGSASSAISANLSDGINFYSEADYLFNSGGNVGINTTKPDYNLTVKGGTYTEAFRLYDERVPPKEGYVLFSDDFGNAYWNDPTGFSLWNLNENGTDIYRLEGSVGIGTINTYGYRLAVDGKILTDEVMVKHPSTWYDIVFDPEFRLLPVRELEEFVIKNRHLPDIPSEKEVTENGYGLSEMNGLLLKKIEELTLYIIEQNKSIEDQKEKIDKVEKRLNELINNN